MINGMVFDIKINYNMYSACYNALQHDFEN